MSARVSAAVKVFETLATENDVSGVTWTPVATSASPAVPRQIEPSAKTIAADMPGMPYFSRSRPRRASRALRRSGVALGLPIRRGHGTAFGVFGGSFAEGTGVTEADGVGLGASDAGGADRDAPDAGLGDVTAVGVCDTTGRPGVGVAEIASGPIDRSKRGDISQPPTATPSTTSATRILRAAWFTRVEDAACRPHHSASR